MIEYLSGIDSFVCQIALASLVRRALQAEYLARNPQNIGGFSAKPGEASTRIE